MDEPNGFYYMRARTYDPKVGSFISEDPIGFEGGTVNLYEYVGNNPVKKIDPSGLGGCGGGDDWGPGDLIVPDYPMGDNFSFPCSRHDECYGCKGKKEGKTKQQCDDQFCKDLLKKCLTGLSTPMCFQNTMFYCAAVKYTSPAQAAFDEARKCCP